MILVTGATGSNGSEIVKRLAAQNIPVRAMVRNCNQTIAITAPSVEVVEANFDRPETLLPVLNGVNRVFLVTNSSEQAEVRRLQSLLVYERQRVNLHEFLRHLHRTMHECSTAEWRLPQNQLRSRQSHQY